MKVLIIEDDESLVTALKCFFEMEGGNYELICANTITKALQVLTQGCPDLVLVDFILKDELAYPVLFKLQDMNCRTVIISAAGRKAEEAATQYKLEMLSKPFELEKLEKLLV